MKSPNKYTPHSAPLFTYRAMNTCPFDQVRVVILGQDPYFKPGQAMGLSFSVPRGMAIPSSLLNIYKELGTDLGLVKPKHGNLEPWCAQGVLLLNSCLTVRAQQVQHVWGVCMGCMGCIIVSCVQYAVNTTFVHVDTVNRQDAPTPHHTISTQAASHSKKGWEEFTDAAITALSAQRKGLVFLLWGNFAKSKRPLIDERKHHVLTAAHPSGLSAARVRALMHL